MRRAWQFVDDHALGLPLGGLIALAWANALPVSYFATTRTLAFAVNEVGMAFVLAFLGQEVLEALLPGGSLRPWRHGALPIVAGIGGVVGAATAYAMYVFGGDERMLAPGWPVACAADVLLAYAVARSIFGRGARTTFVLVLAIVSDLVGLGIVVARASFNARLPVALVLLGSGMALAAMLRRAGTRSVWSYIVWGGLPAWAACRWVGLPGALALLPIVPFMPHSARDLAGDNNPGTHDAWSHLERALGPSVQVIAFFFGFVNSGVRPGGFEPGALAVVAATLVGRPVGVLAGAALARVGGLRFPPLVGWREMVVIAASSGPSLAFGVFFATATFPTGALLTELKIGAIASVVGVLPAFAAARALRVGRFAWR